jgi:hypothetical protein
MILFREYMPDRSGPMVLFFTLQQASMFTTEDEGATIEWSTDEEYLE